jgi:virginiamycin B lyase
MCHSTQCLSTTQCLDNCSATAPCSGTNYCDANGVCQPQIGSGACTSDAQCLSGHCADGVCCNLACNDGCHVCNLAASSGTCVSRFTEYTPPQGTAFEFVPITVGPDNNLWFLEEGLNGVSFMGRITTAGAITEFSTTGVEASAIGKGADGTIWFEDSTDDPEPQIFRITTAGVTLAAFVPQPDSGGAMWNSLTIMADGMNTWIGQLDVNGVVANQVLLLNSNPTVIRRITVPGGGGLMTKGSDGNLWVAVPSALARVDANNVVTNFAISVANGLTSGPDGNLWFSEKTANKIGHMNVNTGMVTDQFPVPTPSSSPGMMVSTSNLVWFTELAPPRLAHMTMAGVATECPLPDTPTAYGNNYTIVAGPDGAVWFTGIGASNSVKVYRYSP